jgi:hypothetical protein
MTRQQAVRFINERGYPLSEKYFSKLCLPSRNEGPRVAQQWGGRPLYTADDILAWVETRCARQTSPAA